MRRILTLLSLFCLIAAAVFTSRCSESKLGVQNLEKPKTSPFLNLAAGAEYVGTKNCISCHQDIHDDYMHTGKGRAFHPVDPGNAIEDFSDVHVFDSYSGYHYTAFWRNGEMVVKEYRLERGDTTYTQEVIAEFVIGSGNQTRSYLFEHQGYFYEIPITWYVKKGIWDLSPGYEKGANTRFSRPIGNQCMNCHNSDFEFVENSVNKFLTVGEGIGCEKCHGPGSLHVEKFENASENEDDSIDYSIVNPAHLSLELQFDVCRQCHLEGVTVAKEGKDIMDFRPGMRLSDFWEVFIPVGENADDFGFASHVERLQMSQCFILSDGKMNCTTCHDAHKPLSANPVTFYNEKCQSCHGSDACGAEHQSLALVENNCIKCHMPKDGTTDIPHVSTSDHFIRVHGEEAIDRQGESGNTLKSFRNFTTGDSRNRDVFMANLEYYEKVDQKPGYLSRIGKFIADVERDQQIKYYYLKKEKAPEELLSGNPMQENNAFSAFYIGDMLEKQNRDGLDWLERAVQLAPDNLEFNTRLANAYMTRKRYEEAKRTYTLILDKNEREIMPMVNLGFLYQMEGDFPKALELTEKALALDPLYLRARENRINIMLNLGDFGQASILLDALIEDYPENQQYAQLKLRIDQLSH